MTVIPPERHYSLRRRTRAVFVAAIVAATIAAVLAFAAVGGLLDARADVIDRADPALFETARLEAALVDQESAVRAFVLAPEPQYLVPYERGRGAQAESVGRLAELVVDIDLAERRLTAVNEAAAAWQRDYAEPTVTAMQAGEPGASDPAALALGRDHFERFRTAVDELELTLREARTSARTELDNATNRLVTIMLVVIVVLLAAVAATWWLVRHSVQLPLDRLRHDARAVAEGELERHIVPVGPRELRQLGVAMEAMRSRIAEDLELATAARRQLEQQQAELSRSNAELEQFAYVASHDLQEPLRKVASFCQLLQNRYGGQLDERADQYIGFAVDGAKRMQALINDLLAFSRVGRLTRPFETVELDGLVAQAVTNLGVAIEEAGAELDIGPLPAVRGEPALLAAVFQNLIGNAVKFRRPEGRPVVRIRHCVIEPVRAEPAPPDDRRQPGEQGPSGNGERADHVRPEERTERHDERTEHEFVVEDNGIGIQADYAERVFVIFQRLHAKEDYAGTGIGLALSRKIVEYHGGRIWVDTDRSGSSAGTTIRFTLPAIEEAAPPPAGDAAGVPAEAEEELSR